MVKEEEARGHETSVKLLGLTRLWREPLIRRPCGALLHSLGSPSNLCKPRAGSWWLWQWMVGGNGWLLHSLELKKKCNY